MTKPISGFAPIADKSATLLILGSMPSQVSLATQQYYAHQRNAFWPIMLRLLDPDCQTTTYGQRTALLLNNDIALWDVLHSCHRTGSLDTAIAMNSIKANNFKAFFAIHPAINTVCFNGAKAENIYKKTVLPQLNSPFSDLTYFRLPSTSPAHATMSFQEKLDIWKHAISNDHV